MQNDDTLLCPTFSSYSCDRLVEIAIKVSEDHKKLNDDDDDLFEFSLSIPQSETSVLHNSLIFPVFDRNIVDNGNQETEKVVDDDSVILVPLRNLFLEEREHRSSTSSSEADESESVPLGSYCVWRRKSVGSSPSTCKKSKSTGSASSKRFWIRDLLRRSNSDGKDSYLFATPKNHNITKTEKTEKTNGRKSPLHSVELTGKSKAAPGSPSSSAHELFYIQNRSIKEGDKRKSFLPYRKDLLSFFWKVSKA